MKNSRQQSLMYRIRCLLARWVHPVRFYGQFSPPLDQVIYQRYFFSRPSAGVFVECGAFDGVCESTCLMFERHLGWVGYNIEPLPHHFSRLEKNRPRSTNLSFALSDATTEAEFVQAVHPTLGNDFGNGSLRHSELQRQELEAMGCTFEHIRVETRPWDAFCNAWSIKHIDLLVLDVEGHEATILSAVSRTSVLPLIAVVEAWPHRAEEVKGHMERLGYIYDGEYRSNLFFRHADFKHPGDES
ncbi:MAG: FkbM family methyltransferase [Pirellulaceae bacterium]